MPVRLSHKIFYSKLLLFGEHIINKGAKGLAIPLPGFSGMLRYGSLAEKTVAASNQSIEKMVQRLIEQEALAQKYDTNAWLTDVEKGMYFDSNIPQGYGLGSSGALVAALYHQYRETKKKRASHREVKEDLAELESYFHGKSSGLDALVCYLNRAVLINHAEVEDIFELKAPKQHALQLFLINTHRERQTAPFVRLFLDKCRDKKFLALVEKSLIPSSNLAVDSFLKGHYASLWRSVQLISQLQLDMMPEFIPKHFLSLWREGLQHQQFSLKICGAGGGGFIIGIAKTDADLQTLLGAQEIVPVMKF